MMVAICFINLKSTTKLHTRHRHILDVLITNSSPNHMLRLTAEDHLHYKHNLPQREMQGGILISTNIHRAQCVHHEGVYQHTYFLRFILYASASSSAVSIPSESSRMSSLHGYNTKQHNVGKNTSISLYHVLSYFVSQVYSFSSSFSSSSVSISCLGQNQSSGYVTKYVCLGTRGLPSRDIFMRHTCARALATYGSARAQNCASAATHTFCLQPALTCPALCRRSAA